MPSLRPVVAICVPMARACHPTTMQCIFGLKLPKPLHFFPLVGHQVSDARNLITQECFKYEDITHILWIDDDMIFAPEDAQRLLDLHLPIVGGLCHNRRHPFMPILVKNTIRGLSFMYEYPEGLVEVDSTGAAFLLVEKHVFAAIHEKYKEGPWTSLGLGGEDVSFCARARDVGFKVFVDTRVEDRTCRRDRGDRSLR